MKILIDDGNKDVFNIILESRRVVKVGMIDTWITLSGELIPKEHICFE